MGKLLHPLIFWPVLLVSMALTTGVGFSNGDTRAAQQSGMVEAYGILLAVGEGAHPLAVYASYEDCQSARNTAHGVWCASVPKYGHGHLWGEYGDGMTR